MKLLGHSGWSVVQVKGAHTQVSMQVHVLFFANFFAHLSSSCMNSNNSDAHLVLDIIYASQQFLLCVSVKCAIVIRHF